MQPEKTQSPTALFEQVKEIIEQSRRNVAVAVNTELTLLYWQVGHAIRQDILQNNRAEYGKKVVSELARQLVLVFGRSFTEKSLRRMIQLADVFPDRAIVATLSRQLNWSHLTLLIPIKDALKRAFYTEMCRLQRWSVRELSRQIDALLYERTAISKKPEEVIAQELTQLHQTGQLSPDLVFKDTYVLDFLGLSGTFSEATLEQAIVSRIQAFILEIGTGFAFLERQKRITVDDTDYYLDLLFYHRKLRRLVAIDLKLGKFRPEYKGQMELYLRWLQRYDMQESEHPPIGLLLCSEGNTEHIELLMLDDQTGIRVAQYLTELPPKEWFEQKLQRAVEMAKHQLENQKR